MYYVLGIEPFKVAEVRGTFTNKKKAVSLALFLEQNKNPLCCQNYEAMTVTEAKKTYKLYSCGGVICV